jgi:hypothetical protein
MLGGRWHWTGAPGLVVIGIVRLGAALALFGADSGGREIFYGYIALYRRLFGG